MIPRWTFLPGNWQQQMRAITHMVASGVEGLQPSRVSVIDGHGRMLSGGDEDSTPALTASQAEASCPAPPSPQGRP